MLTLNDGRSELWQWDTGRTLAVDTDCSQVHFSNKVFGRSIDVDVVGGAAIIPDILLQTDKDLNVWAFVGMAENGYTKISKTFKVNRRNKPADYVFTPPDQTSLEEIKEKIDYLESIQDPDAIKNAVEGYLEQNPVEAPVQSVNGKTGAVTLTYEDVGAISKDDLQAATNEALAQAKASGEFDGADGKSAYQYAQEGGYNGTEAEFADKMAQEIPTVDDTLTQSGKAADAAMVGERLSAINEAIANVGKPTDEQVSAAVNAYLDANPVSGGISTTAKNLLITILRSGVYTADQSDNITALETALGGGTTEPEEPDVPAETTYAINNELINCTSSNSETSVKENAAYSATLTANDGYTLTGGTVTVTMGGVDVTADVYANGVVSIPAVTGNVEIVASAVESDPTKELNTNGLVFNYDFRNSSMEIYNLPGWSGVYRTVDQTGNALIFGTKEATGDEKGLLEYSFRENRLVSSETEKVKLGETYTVQALFRAGDRRAQSNLFGWGKNSNVANKFIIAAKYLAGTTETSTTEVHYSHEDTQYIVITYVVSGKSLTVYHNTDLVLTLDGNNYDDFTNWMDYGAPNTIYNKGYTTAFVGYNRALTEVEIIDNLAYFKTLEVTA